jgi:hypothetical protein
MCLRRTDIYYEALLSSGAPRRGRASRGGSNQDPNALVHPHPLLGCESYRPPPSRGCVVIGGKAMLVILNEVKNLVESIGWKTEILRLMPQNDITTQSPKGEGIMGEILNMFG